MKILKYILIGIGILIGLQVLGKMLQKSVNTRIVYKGFIRGENKLIIEVYANNQLINTLHIQLTALQKQTFNVNDYRVEITNVATLVLFRIIDDKGREVNKIPIDVFTSPETIIFNEY